MKISACFTVPQSAQDKMILCVRAAVEAWSSVWNRHRRFLGASMLTFPAGLFTFVLVKFDLLSVRLFHTKSVYF